MSTSVCSVPTAEQRLDAPTRLRPEVVLAAALALACLPLLVLHAERLWEKPHYQFFPWALLGAAVLAWRRDKTGPLVPGLPAIGYTILGAGWCLLTVAGYLVSPWTGLAAALVVYTGFAWLLGGRRLVTALLPSLLLLAVLLPPPLRLDERLMLQLQTIDVNLASHALDWLDLPHVPLAHTLQVPGDQLLVDEACSGIASLLSVVTFSLFWSFYLRRKPVHTVLLICCAVAFVVLGNAVRIVTITILKARYQIDLLHGWKHDAIGLVVFAVCLALLASMDQGILFFTESVSLLWSRIRRGSVPDGPTPKVAPETSPPEPETAPTPEVLSPRLAGILGATFAVVGLLTVYNGWIHPHAFRSDPVRTSLDSSSIQQKLAADSLPQEIGHWKQTAYERKTPSSTDPIGHYSDVWSYRQGNLQALISVDYPFRGGHDLTNCYVCQGWRVLDTSAPVLETPENSASNTVAVNYERSFVEKGYLWFSALDEQGHWLSADVVQGTNNMNRLMDRVSRDDPSLTVQIQVFISTQMPLEENQRQEAQKLFQDVRTLLQDRLISTGRE